MSADILRASAGQQLAARIQPALVRVRSWLLPLVTGYLLGRLTNATSDATIKTLADVWSNLFALDRTVNVLSWTSLLMLLAFSCLSAFVGYHRRRGRPETLLASLARMRVDAIVGPYGKEAFAWGPDVTLQLAPDLQTGWPVEEVEVVYDGSTFSVPAEDKQGYTQYVAGEPERFKQDGTKYMLVRNPTAFSDAPGLTLEICRTKFSVVRYFQERVITIRPRRDAFLAEAIGNGTIGFPSSLCMQAAVITKDDRVLVTKRAPKVEYSPNAWSVSVEEQLSPDDLRPGAKGVVKRWAQRLLLEELAVEPRDYDIRNLRLLAVFLEVDLMNCSLAAVLRVNLSSAELKDIIETMPRTDYEFTEWRFLSYRELAAELRNPSLLLHPSSGYRIVLSLANRYGAARVADVLFPQ